MSPSLLIVYKKILSLDLQNSFPLQTSNLSRSSHEAHYVLHREESAETWCAASDQMDGGIV